MREVSKNMKALQPEVVPAKAITYHTCIMPMRFVAILKRSYTNDLHVSMHINFDTADKCISPCNVANFLSYFVFYTENYIKALFL